MNSRVITIVVVLFILVVAGMFYFAYFKSSNVETTETPGTQDQKPAGPGPYDYIDRIDAKHFYSDGKHVLVGEISLPTPCDLLTWDANVAESFPEQVTVLFNVINNADTCVQVVTQQRFKVEFNASKDATIKARFMGRDVNLNLVPAAEGESPDDYELFIKG